MVSPARMSSEYQSQSAGSGSSPVPTNGATTKHRSAPSDVSWDASASAIACEPPSATGQPTAWAAPASIAPAAAVVGRPRGWKLWAAMPAYSARASSVRPSAESSCARAVAARSSNDFACRLRATSSAVRRLVSGPPAAPFRPSRPPPRRPARVAAPPPAGAAPPPVEDAGNRREVGPLAQAFIALGTLAAVAIAIHEAEGPLGIEVAAPPRSWIVGLVSGRPHRTIFPIAGRKLFTS